MGLLKGTTVIAKTFDLPKGQYTFKATSYKEVEPNEALDKVGYVNLSGYIPELKVTYSICLFENSIEYTLSELKQTYFNDQDITDVGILDSIIGLELPIWVSTMPNKSDPAKVFTNVNFKKPYSIQADEIMGA